jgi:segregation and condensation protein A
MSIGFSSSEDHLYQVTTPIFEGPLELLLSLIEKTELDISKLSIALVTDQFLSYIGKILDKDKQEVSSFLIVASKLILIKSEMLLPRPVIRSSEEEDPGEVMARQLREYKKFKNAANFLLNLENENSRTYLRISSSIKVNEILDLSDITPYDLLIFFQALFHQKNLTGFPGTEVINPITIEDKVKKIYDLLTLKKKTTFNQLLSKTDNWIEIVVTFLAVLELIKQRWLQVRQSELFGDMDLEVADNAQDVDWTNFVFTV